MLISFTLFFSLNSKSTHSFAYRLIFLVKFSKKTYFIPAHCLLFFSFVCCFSFAGIFSWKFITFIPFVFAQNGIEQNLILIFRWMRQFTQTYTKCELRFAFFCHHLKKDELLQAISIAGLLCMHSWMNSEHHKFSNWVWISADPGLIKLTKQIWWLCCALLRMSLRILRLMIATKMAAMIRFLCEMVKKLTSLKDFNSLYQTEISKFNEGVWMKLCVNRNWLFIYYILHYD